MKRSRVLAGILFLLVVAALAGAQVASAAPATVSDAMLGELNGEAATGPAPAELQRAAAQGDGSAQAALAHWASGGEVVPLPEGGFVIPVDTEVSTSGTSTKLTTATATSAQEDSEDYSFLGDGVWAINPLTGTPGVKGTFDPDKFSPQPKRGKKVERHATAALHNLNECRFTWSFVPGRSANELHLERTFEDGEVRTSIFERFVVTGDGEKLKIETGDQPELKIAKSTNYSMEDPEDWNVYWNQTPILYMVPWYEAEGTGTATGLSAGDPKYGEGEFTSISFLTENWDWQRQDAEFFEGKDATPVLYEPDDYPLTSSWIEEYYAWKVVVDG